MTVLLIFGLTLLLAILLSELAERSVLSMSVLFLVVGFAVGEGVLGWLPYTADTPVVSQLATAALLAVLFTDGMKMGWRDLKRAWHLPGRALLLGMPLTMAITAVLAHAVTDLSWLDSWLVAAVLGPTDPVFASAIVGREGVSRDLRDLLNVESGLNDGLALPVVLGILAVAGASDAGLAVHLGEVAFGAALGVGIPWIAVQVENLRLFQVAKIYHTYFPFAIWLIVFATAELVHANPYIAAFAAGVTTVTMRSDLRESFHAFGEHLSELLKLAAVLVFAALISPRFLAETSAGGYAFAALSLLIPRPLGLMLALLGTRLGWRDRLAAMWFGPRGFASIVYGIIVLQSGVEGANVVFHVIAVAVVGSMIAHSSTDVVVAHWLRRHAGPDPAHGSSGR